MEIDNLIRYFAAENAVSFKGKAKMGAVIGKILAEHPEKKKDMKTLSKKIGKIVSEINSMSQDEQEVVYEKLKEDAPEPPEKEEQEGLPDLKDAERGKVVTRIPPEPSKYAHVGHAISFLINYMYAEKYDGKCVLKFEDTNPEKVTKEFVDAMTQDITGYLGIKPSEITLVSDLMPVMYRKADELVQKKEMYVCKCPREKMGQLRQEGKRCGCTKEYDNAEEWDNMKKGLYKKGEAILRLRGDMKSKNMVMRDPVMFRISEAEHFKHRDKYKAWPLYDYENVVSDCELGVTHILRSSEFGWMRNELQNYLKDLMGYKKQEITHYGRFNIRGATTKGREIREKIKNGEVTGWDDPSLVTLKALKRRGILPEALQNLISEVGLSKSTSKNIDWTLISSLNRSILDEKADRYFFVEDPVKIKISKAPSLNIDVSLHPDFPKRGKRTFSTGEDFYVAREDFDKFKEGSLIRLKDCLNFVKKGDNLVFDSEDHEKFKEKGSLIIQWLPADAKLVKTKIRMPDNSWKEGLSEENVSDLKEGDIIQFTRFAFCRLDRKEKDQFVFWFTNK